MVDATKIRNDIIADATAKAEELIRVETIKETVLEALKDKGPFTAGPGYMHTYGADIHLDAIVDTLPEAIELAEKMNPLSLYLCREGGTSFLPDSPLIHKRAGNNPAWQAANPMKEPELVQPYAYKIDGLLGYKETKTLFFFCDIAGYRVKFEVEVKQDNLTHRNYKVREYSGGRKVENHGLKNDSGYFSRYLRFYSSDEHPAPYVAY